jgi:fatty acid-binding protein DegV
MNIGIVTDSTSSLNNEEQEKLGIDVVSLYVSKDDSFFKATELSREEYYRELETAKKTPKTSQANPQDFQDVYEKEQGN